MERTVRPLNRLLMRYLADPIPAPNVAQTKQPLLQEISDNPVLNSPKMAIKI